MLYKYGAVSAELLKNYLQGIGQNPTTLLALSTEELKAQRESKSKGTYNNNRSSDKHLNSFVRSRGEEDIPLMALTMGFFDDYRFYLKKKEGYAPETINRHLCWLSRLMYRAVGQGTIRFNPFEEVKYEAVESKPRFLSKGDVAKLLAFPLQDEGAELSLRMFLFSVFTDLTFADLQSLRTSQIETNSERKLYIRKARQKTEVESLIPLHPISEQILALYTKGEEQGRLQDIPRYDKQRETDSLSQSRGLGLWHSHSTGLSRRCSPQLWHADLGGRYSDREYRQDDETFIHCQHANLRPNHRPKDCKGYG